MQIPAIPVKQWLPEWEAVEFDSMLGRKKPQQQFFMFTMNAKHLRALCGIYRRTLQNDSVRHRQFGIQRRHDEKRSNEIADYVRHGYPDTKLRPKSKFSLISESTFALDDLLRTVSSRGARAILTFPDHECSNGLSGDSVREIASKHFTVREKRVDSKFSTLGGTSDKARKQEAGRSARQAAKELMLVLSCKK